MSTHKWTFKSYFRREAYGWNGTANWPIDRDYMAPPSTGELVELDPALLVTPQKGLEVGYVPIVTRQESASN